MTTPSYVSHYSLYAWFKRINLLEYTKIHLIKLPKVYPIQEQIGTITLDFREPFRLKKPHSFSNKSLSFSVNFLTHNTIKVF